MATTRSTREADLFSSSPARPSHHRTQLPPRKPGDVGANGVGGSNTKNPLKRTASAALLLTPPGSPEKEKRLTRSSKRTLTDSEDEDDDEVMASPGRANGRARKPVSKKPARTSTMVIREKRAQGRLGGGDGSIVWPRGRQASTNNTLQPFHRAGVSASPDGMQVDQVRLDSDEGEQGSPMQPSTPKRIGNIASLPTVPEPTTPTRRATRSQTKGKGPNPVRDSPNNPFLGGPSQTAGPREPVQEKPTMTYVFRGAKAVFRNPNYGGPDVEAQQRHRLHPAHPDFSPDLMTAPKLLFPPAIGNLALDSDDEGPVTPPRYNLRSPSNRMTTPSPRGRVTKRRRVGEAPDSAGALFGGPKTPAMAQ
ncbi:hypothetical protein FRB90_007634 [Tulasnella sp. 427]|nr:hypothetical protein FRB90_007634 [Tulasnella sp. 427]